MDDCSDGLSDLERQFLRHVSCNQLTEARHCLMQGVNVHVRNVFERDAAQISTRNGNTAMLKFLLEEGASVSTRGPRGDSLAHLAAWNGHVDTLRFILFKGGLITAVDMHGHTAVHYAARRGEIGILKYVGEELGLADTLFMQESFDGQLPLDCVPRRGPDMEALDACRSYLSSSIAVTTATV